MGTEHWRTASNVTPRNFAVVEPHRVPAALRILIALEEHALEYPDVQILANSWARDQEVLFAGMEALAQEKHVMMEIESPETDAAGAACMRDPDPLLRCAATEDFLSPVSLVNVRLVVIGRSRLAILFRV